VIQKRLEEECLLGEGGQEEGQEGNEAVLEVNQSSRLGFGPFLSVRRDLRSVFGCRLNGHAGIEPAVALQWNMKSL